MILQGRAWKFGDDINTDIIAPSRYCELDPQEYKKHIMEPIRPDFYSQIKQGDMIFAGKSFGIGSSRGQAVVGLLEAGLRAIVAHSFARIFYRSAINEGLPVIECPEASDQAEDGDLVQIDLASGIIVNQTRKKEFQFHPFPQLVRDILLAGGGIHYYRQKENAPTGR